MIFDDNPIFSMIKILLITVCTLGMMLSLTIYKYRFRRVFLLFLVYLIWVALSTAFLLHYFGYNVFLRSFLLTISAPAIYLAYKIDQRSPAQSVFNYTTQLLLSLLLTVAVILINQAIDGNPYTDILIRLSLYAITIFVEWRFLRKPFCQLSNVITKGWGLLSLMPVSFSILFVLIGIYPVHYIKNPVNILYLAVGATAMVIMYFIVFQCLLLQYRLQITSRDRDLLALQIGSIKKDAQNALSTKEDLRILKHDLRHYASIIEADLKTGSIEQAVATLHTFQSAISDAETKCYCTDPLINSILSSYMETAKAEGIAASVTFTAPPSDKIDATAFAVALANALENALSACKKEPGRRRIVLKSRIFNGQYLLELSNTCTQKVTFNAEGLPVSEQGDGHGFGVRSILAFARRQNITLHFYLENDCFILQMRCDIQSTPPREISVKTHSRKRLHRSFKK